MVVSFRRANESHLHPLRLLLLHHDTYIQIQLKRKDSGIETRKSANNYDVTEHYWLIYIRVLNIQQRINVKVINSKFAGF